MTDCMYHLLEIDVYMEESKQFVFILNMHLIGQCFKMRVSETAFVIPVAYNVNSNTPRLYSQW